MSLRVSCHDEYLILVTQRRYRLTPYIRRAGTRCEKGQKLQERRVRKLAVRKQMVSTLLWRAGNLKIGRNTIGSAQHIGDRELRVDLDKNLAFQTSYK